MVGKPAFGGLFGISLALFLATLAAYSGARLCGFVNFDDPVYVTANTHLRDGITPAGIAWAITSTQDANWFPLTRLSHLLDVQLFGMNPAGHHVTSVVIHAFTVVLLFFVLQRLTGAKWRSAFVAALFGVHPLHVESVAWVSERKDVLSAFFWMLTMLAYLRYVEQPRPLRYAILVLSFVLGLMSKPMVVTLPFALLLLDFWPLRRASLSDRPTLNRLVIEKIPLFALAACGAVLTFVIQTSGGATPLDAAPLMLRIQNALVSYVAYLAQMFWPTDLAILYPFPARIPVWETLAATVLLAGVTILVLKLWRRFPYLAIGWLWYLGTLVPVIGFIQVGFQARADRYTYMPMIGVSIMLAWGVSDAFARRATVLVTAGAGATLLACALLTRAQVAAWVDGETLFRHAVAVTSGNYVAHNNLGYALGVQGRLDEAAAQCREALKIRPSYSAAHTNLGEVYLLQGRLEDAIAENREATRLNPKETVAFANWGAALRKQGHPNTAAEKYREALRIDPENIVARVGLAQALAQQGRREESVHILYEAVRLRPDYANAHAQLGNLLGSLGRTDEAISELSEAVRLNPNDAPAHYNLGLSLGMKGRFGEAIGEFQRTVELNPRDADAFVGLANGQASIGHFDDAIANYRKALELNPKHARAQANLEHAAQLQQQARSRR